MQKLQQGAKQLQPLQVGQEVAIQDPLSGGKAGRWTKSGTVVEVLPYDAYQVRIHGSRHVSKRNRSHLRKITLFTPEVKLYPAASPEALTAPQEGVTESGQVRSSAATPQLGLAIPATTQAVAGRSARR